MSGRENNRKEKENDSENIRFHPWQKNQHKSLILLHDSDGTIFLQQFIFFKMSIKLFK